MHKGTNVTVAPCQYGSRLGTVIDGGLFLSNHVFTMGNAVAPKLSKFPRFNNGLARTISPSLHTWLPSPPEQVNLPLPFPPYNKRPPASQPNSSSSKRCHTHPPLTSTDWTARVSVKKLEPGRPVSISAVPHFYCRHVLVRINSHAGRNFPSVLH